MERLLMQLSRNVLERALKTWNTIPEFARYRENIWDTGVAPNNCFNLLYYFLHQTYSEFLLHRVIARHGGSSWDAVYQVAQKLLSAVLIISRQRDRTAGLSRDFSWVVSPLYHLS
jgi:hypothetical protein